MITLRKRGTVTVTEESVEATGFQFGYTGEGKRPPAEDQHRTALWWAIQRLYEEVLGERERASPRKRGSARKEKP